MKAHSGKSNLWLGLIALSLILAVTCFGWTGFAFASELSENADDASQVQVEAEDEEAPVEEGSDDAEFADEATLYAQATEHDDYMALALSFVRDDGICDTLTVDPADQFTIRVSVRLNATNLFETWPVHEGDTTTIEIPEKLKLVSAEDFELRDADGNLVANATIGEDAKTIVLSYTDFVEGKTGVKAQFDIDAQLDESVSPIPVAVLWETEASAIQVWFNLPEGEDADTTDKTRDSESTSVGITIVWDDGDNQDGIRPEDYDYAEKIHLYAGDTEVTSTYADVFSCYDNDDNTYSVSWEGLPKKSDGEDIVYKVKVDEIDNYETDSTEAVDGDTITNVYAPEVTSVTLITIWHDEEDADGIRPTLEEYALLVHLYYSDYIYSDAVPTVTAKDKNTYITTWNNVSKKNNGHEITYGITGDPIDGYESDKTDVDGGDTIINMHIPDTKTDDNKQEPTEPTNSTTPTPSDANKGKPTEPATSGEQTKNSQGSSKKQSDAQTSTKPSKLPQTGDLASMVPVLVTALGGVGSVSAGKLVSIAAKRKKDDR